MGKLFAAMKRFPKRTSAIIAVVIAAVIVPATLFAWGPNRDTYTQANPATKVVFNSIIDNPNIGDERNFVNVRDAAITTDGGWQDTLNAEPGKEYIVRVYVHNNAADNLNLKAINTKVKASVPNTTGKKVSISGFVSADNATPREVWDDIHFTSTKDFNLAYVDGSAEIFNGATGPNGKKLPDSIVTSTGAPVSYTEEGVVPGCFKYASYVYFKVKPQFAPDATFDVQKTVRKSGDKDFVESVAAKPGDKVDYQIYYKNTSTVQMNNVVIRDVLPAGVTYVPGSTWLHNSSGTRQVADGVTTNGIDIGGYVPNGNAYVKFTAQVAGNNDLPICGPNTLRNVAKVETDYGTKEDDAKVTVPKECQTECKYSCDALTVSKIDRTTFKFTTATTQQGATFKKVTYVIRNEQGTEVDRKESTAKTLDYTRTTVGKFTVEALVTFTVNGQDKTVSSANCKKPFEVEKEPETPAYKCDGLTVEKINRTSFKFATQYTATGGATLKNVVYVIRDAQGAEITRQTSANYTQDKVGSYTVEAIVTVTVNGQDKVAPGDCKKPFEVEKIPETPVYTCDALTASKISRTEYSFTGKATATGGATIVNYAFDFGDSTPVQTVTNPNEVKHTYAKDGTYTAKLSVTVKVGDANKTVTSEKCKVTVTVTPEECKPGIPVGDDRCKEECKPGVPVGHKDCEEPKECKPGIPVGHKDCEEKPEFCTVKGKEHLPKNSPDCKETPAVTELPKTGASDSIIALIGAGSLIASIGYYIASRRAL